MVKVNTYISNPQISCYLIITKFKLIYLNNITYICICNILCILENTYEKNYKIVKKYIVIKLYELSILIQLVLFVTALNGV